MCTSQGPKGELACLADTRPYHYSFLGDGKIHFWKLEHKQNCIQMQRAGPQFVPVSQTLTSSSNKSQELVILI